MEIEKDTKVLKQLNLLRNETPTIYYNLKRNIDAVYKMYLYSKADQDFMSKFTYAFDCYSIDKDNMEDFAAYCGVPDTDRIFLFVKKTGGFAMLFCVDAENYITRKAPIYNQEDIDDILFTFQDKLSLCGPDDIL